MTSQPPGPQKSTALYTNHINAIERSPLGPPHLNVDIDVMIDSPINIIDSPINIPWINIGYGGAGGYPPARKR